MRTQVLNATLLIVTVAIGLTEARQSGRFTVTDFVRAKSFAINIRPAISPDGSLVAYTLISRDPQDDPDNSVATSLRSGVPVGAIDGDIVLTTIATGTTRTLTVGDGSSFGPVWSPDGRYLAFLSTQSQAASDRRARLWLWDRTADRQRQVSAEAIRGELEWTPDSQSILVQLLPSDESRAVVLPASRTRSTATVFSFDSAAKAAPMAAARLTANSGTLATIGIDGSVRRLVENETIASSALASDGQRVLLVLPRGIVRAGSPQRSYELAILARSSSVRRTLVSNAVLVGDEAIRWSPDGSYIAYKTPQGVVITSVADGVRASSGSHDIGSGIDRDNRPPFWASAGRTVYYTTDTRTVWGLTAGGNEPLKLSDFPDSFVEIISDHDGAAWAPDGPGSVGVYVHSFAADRNAIYSISLSDRRAKRLMETDRSIGSANVPYGMASSPRDGSLVYLSESAHESPDLWIADRQFKNDRRLTHANPHFDSQPFGRSRIIEWHNATGEPLHGALLLPPDYKQGVRYPMVVSIYGGVRQSRDANRFGMARLPLNNHQLLAMRGYIVFLPDSLPTPGDPIGGLERSILPGIDRVIELGYADPERIGLAGSSYGGYSTLALLTRTSRFKAAVATCGLYNLTSVYLELGDDGASRGIAMADTGRFFFTGTLWDNRNAFVENSPVFHLDKVTTPLLLVHGTADEATRYTESEQVFTGLRRLGKRVEYVRYADEGHAISNPANQEDYWQRLSAWFDRYLR